MSNTINNSINNVKSNNGVDTDDEEIFRKVRGLLNKLTPEKFDKLSIEFCNLTIKSPKVLKGIILLILDKALNEPAYSALYAQLCQRLDKFVPNFEHTLTKNGTIETTLINQNYYQQQTNNNNNQPASQISTFRKLLLTICQHEFDNRSNYCYITAKEDEKLDEEERKAAIEYAKQTAKKKMLGNVKFIGELGKLDLLSEAILHKCIKTLLEKKKEEKYSEMSDDLECLCKMMPTIGKKLDQGEAVKLMDQYFERMKKLRSISVVSQSGGSNSKDGLPQRIKFLLQDCIDLRSNNWIPRQSQLDQAPKTMNEVRNSTTDPMDSKLNNPNINNQLNKFNQFTSDIDIVKSSASSAPLIYKMYEQFTQKPNMSLLNAINDITISKKNQFLFNQANSCFDESVYSKNYKYINDEQTDLEDNDQTNNSSLISASLNIDANKPKEQQILQEDSSKNKEQSLDCIKETQIVEQTVEPKATMTLTTPPPEISQQTKTSLSSSPVAQNSQITNNNLTNSTSNIHYQNFNVKNNNNNNFYRGNRQNNYKNQYGNQTNINHLDQLEYPMLNNQSKSNDQKNRQTRLNRKTNYTSNLDNTEPLSLLSPNPSQPTINQLNKYQKPNQQIDSDNSNKVNTSNSTNYKYQDTKVNENNPSTRSFSTSSSSTFSSSNPSSVSSSVSPPLQINNNNNNANSINNNLKIDTLIGSSTSSSSTLVIKQPNIPSNINQDQNFNRSNIKPDTKYSSNRYNSNSYQYNNNQRFNNNNYYNKNYNQYRYQENISNALGVVHDEILPLNKPIIPINKLIKHDSHKQNKQNSKLINPSGSQPQQIQQQQFSPTGTLNPQTNPANMINLNLNLLNTNQSTNTSNNQIIAYRNNSNNLNQAIINEEVKGDIKKVIEFYLNESSSSEIKEDDFNLILDETITKLKSFKLTNEQISELVYLIIVHTLSKTDTDRLNTSKLFIEFNKIGSSSWSIPATLNVNNSLLLTSEIFINGFKLVLQNLNNLESEYHFVKSNISLYAARAVCDQIITFNDLSLLMKYGAYYPLFFLCMQNMHKLKTPEWLRSHLERSKINLIDMLPNNERNKERLIQILEDRELSFVYPMLKIESILFENIFIENFDSNKLRQWILDNVESGIRNSSDFIQSLITCIVKNAAEKSVLIDENRSHLGINVDKANVYKQKQLIQKYQDLLKEYLASNQSKQIEAIYAIQVYAESKGLPKYLLPHLFNQMYDLEIIEEEAFYAWKDEINENYPNKGRALFHLQKWFNWLQEAPEESSNSESELSSSSLISKSQSTHNESKTVVILNQHDFNSSN